MKPVDYEHFEVLGQLADACDNHLAAVAQLPLSDATHLRMAKQQLAKVSETLKEFYWHHVEEDPWEGQPGAPSTPNPQGEQK
jgi:hypothetical protein